MGRQRMKDYVEALSAELTERYAHYLETFMVDLWSDLGLIEFRIGYSLRIDHRLRDFTIKVDANASINDIERRAVIAAVFVEIEDRLDEAISEHRVGMN
jgi:hypothetical protein